MVKAENHIHLNIILLTIVLVNLPNFLFSFNLHEHFFENDTVKLYAPIDDSTFQSDVNEITTIEPDSLQLKNDTLNVAPKTEKPTEKVVLIDFNVNAEINYKIVAQFRTNNGKGSFLKSMEYSKRLDSLISITNNLRTNYQKATTNSDKETIGEQVLKLEVELIGLKADADNYLNNAREFEIGFWKDAQELDYRKYLTESDSIANLIKQQNKPKPIEITPIEIEVKTENTDSTTSTALIKPNQVKNEQVVYKIQIGNYNTKLPAAIDKLFKKIGALRKIDTYIDEKGSTVYTIGELVKINDAIKLQNQIRQEGVKDAFIIAIYKGKRITLNEAKEIK